MSNKPVIYNVGIYLRLSKDDGDDIESESITNQRRIIKEYISKYENMKIYDEYIDDGYSGANFNRPDFKRLIKDIGNKKLNMVITKNLARFGRNYIESGSYIEKFFPDNGVRYIAILDNVDNFEDNVSNDIMPIKSVFNEKYCRNTSIAVKKSKRKKMNDGFYSCNTPPFGYKKDIDNPEKLIVDEVSSKTVKKIFELKEKGYTIKKICEYLDENNYITPAVYMNIKGLENIENKNIWRAGTIKRILGNKVYIGHCVRGKTQNISYKSKDRIYVKRNDFIVTYNTHEAIITEQTFNNIHPTKKYGSTIKIIENDYLLKDLIFCKECGKKFIFKKCRNKVYIYCRVNSESNRLCSNDNHFEYSNIENKVLEYIITMYREYFENDYIKDNLYQKVIRKQIDSLQKEKDELKRELGKLCFKITSLYNERLSESVREEEYKERYYNLSNERKSVTELIENKEKEINNEKFKLQTLDYKKQILEKLERIEKKDFNNINIKELINRIDIHKQEISIYFNFAEKGKFKI